MKKEKTEELTGLEKEKFDWLMIIPYTLIALLIIVGVLIIIHVLK